MGWLSGRAPNKVSKQDRNGRRGFDSPPRYVNANNRPSRVLPLRGGPMAGREVRFDQVPPREVEPVDHVGPGRYVLLAPNQPWACYVWSAS